MNFPIVSILRHSSTPGFPCGASDQESTCNAGKRCGFDPWTRKIPWRRAWQPTPVFMPGESHGQRSLVGYGLWGCKESDTNKQLTHTHTHTHISAWGTHSSTLAWNIPWMGEPGRLQSMESQRVRQDWVTSLSFYSSFWRRTWQPTPVFLPGESQAQGSLVGCRLRGCKESDMTKELTHTNKSKHCGI